MGRTIVCTDGMCDGRPRLSGTSIEVRDVIQLINGGASLSDLCDQFPGMTLQDIRQIRRYYEFCTAEVDADIAAKQKEGADELGV